MSAVLNFRKLINFFSVKFRVFHKRAAIYAYNHNVSLNSVVEESVAEYLSTRQD